MKPLAGLALAAVLVPLSFWLQFGRVDGFALGFTAFLVLLGAAFEYLPARAAEARAKGLDQRVTYQRRPLDVLGGVWLLSIPFAPAVSWIMTNGLDVDSSNWRWLLGLRALLCVVVPVICVLPLLRFVRRCTAGIALAILGIGTAFPVATGWGSAYDVLQGPAWQSVVIQQLDDVAYTSKAGSHVRAKEALVVLADGRTLSRAANVKLYPGTARVLVLRGFGRVIDVEK